MGQWIINIEDMPADFIHSLEKRVSLKYKSADCSYFWVDRYKI